MKIEDNSGTVLSELDRKKRLILKVIGEQAEGHAKHGCPVDTGRLRNSITNVNDGNTLYVGTNVDYAPYVEFGTGKYASDGHGRQTPWGYYDDKGEYHITAGMQPYHMLRNSIANHEAEYRALIEKFLKD